MFSINVHIHDVAIFMEDGRNMFLGEGAVYKSTKQTGLAAGTIADDDELSTERGGHFD